MQVEDLLDRRVDEVPYARLCESFRGKLGVVRNTHDGFARAERINRLRNAGSQADYPLRMFGDGHMPSQFIR